MICCKFEQECVAKYMGKLKFKKMKSEAFQNQTILHKQSSLFALSRPSLNDLNKSSQLDSVGNCFYCVAYLLRWP